MKRLRALGIPQAVLPPQPRPDVALLRRLGFDGTDAEVLYRASRRAPEMLAMAASGASMWTANAATVCPSADSGDGRVHFTPANLVSSLHRAIEADTTRDILQQIFHEPGLFRVHSPLPSSSDMGDEGAANHTRFCERFDSAGVQLFVYGTAGSHDQHRRPKRFSARQSRRASEAVIRLHGIDPRRVVLAQQHPDAIDAGVFHNDVIAVGHRGLLFCHASAFVDQETVYRSLRQQTAHSIRIVEVSEEELSISDAVSTYLFNSQIVTTETDRTVLIAPHQCYRSARVRELIDGFIDEGVFDAAEYVDVGQSMNNGGGPACLRLRVVLTAEERSAIAANVFLTDSLEQSLHEWIVRHYRESLSQADLADPSLLDESCAALDELTELLDLGPIYRFQR